MSEVIKNNTPTTTIPQATLQDLLKQVTELTAKVNAKEAAPKVVAPQKEKPKEIDWEKIDESNLFDLSIDIPTIEHRAPNSERVPLKDKQYIARWINVNNKRMGMAISDGYTYVQKEDLDPNESFAYLPDASGHYVDTDTVAMKIHKSRYYPRLRKNYEQTMAIRTKLKVRDKVGDNTYKPNNQGILDSRTQDSLQGGALSFYEEKAVEDPISDNAFEAAIEAAGKQSK